MRNLIAGLLAVSGAAITTIASAESQQSVDRGAIARSINQVCMSSPMGADLASPELGCACAVGVLSARMNDRQFYVIGRIAPIYFNNEALAQLDLTAEGFTEEELQEVADLIESAIAVSDQTCWPLGS